MKNKHPFPPSPFLRKEVTGVQALRAFLVIDLLPLWGGPSEAA